MRIFGKTSIKDIEKMKRKKDVEGLIKAVETADQLVSSHAETILLLLIAESRDAEDVETLIKIYNGCKHSVERLSASGKTEGAYGRLLAVMYGAAKEGLEKIRKK